VGYDIVERLAVDAGHRTIGQLVSERAEALVEIHRLRAQLADQAAQQRLARRAAAMLPEVPKPPGATAVAGALLSLSSVCARLSVSRPTIYRWIGKGLFPRPVHIGQNMVRWPVAAVDAWQATASAGRPPGRRMSAREQRIGPER
jgi:prophage regulatory protein